jgi:hypothetical protein
MGTSALRITRRMPPGYHGSAESSPYPRAFDASVRISSTRNTADHLPGSGKAKACRPVLTASTARVRAFERSSFIARAGYARLVMPLDRLRDGAAQQLLSTPGASGPRTGVYESPRFGVARSRPVGSRPAEASSATAPAPAMRPTRGGVFKSLWRPFGTTEVGIFRTARSALPALQTKVLRMSIMSADHSSCRDAWWL